MNVALSIAASPLSGSNQIGAIPNQPSSVTKVEFYVDGVLKATDTTSPYTYLWDTTTVLDGPHYVEAVAYFDRNKKASVKKAVTVLNAVTPPSPPPVQAPPVNTTLPGIFGTATEGQNLDVSNGVWTNSPTSYTRQWMRCDAAGANPVAIPGAVGQTYRLVLADVGATLRCVVTAFNSFGAGPSVQTAQTGVVAGLAPAVPVLVTTPVIAGSPVVGNTLSVSNGSWTQSPTSYTHCWDRCDSAGNNCVDIVNGQLCNTLNPTYIVTSADVGKTIKCWTTAINGVGSSTPVLSAATAVVTGALPPPPPPPPTGDYINQISDLSLVFLPVGTSSGQIQQGVTNPAGLGGGVWEINDAAGSGFRFVATPQMQTTWGTATKACLGVLPVRTAVGAYEEFRFKYRYPVADNPEFPNAWHAGTIFEFGHYVSGNSGLYIGLDGRQPFSSNDEGHHLGVPIPPWGIGSWQHYKICNGFELVRGKDYLVEARIRYRTDNTGYFQVKIDGVTIIDEFRPTLVSTSDIPKCQPGWYSDKGNTKNGVEIRNLEYAYNV